MSKQSAVSFVPSEGLEQELDNVVLKLKKELKKMNLRIKDLEKTLQSQEEKNKAVIVQNENRLTALSDEMNRNQELLKQKEKEITILKEKSLKDNIYHQNMIKENEEHIKRLEDDIQSMNNDIQELNLEHSKQSEKLKFNLNETKLELKKKTNAERVRINEFEYKFAKLQTENDELVHSLESTVTSLRSENEEKTKRLKVTEAQYIRKAKDHAELATQYCDLESDMHELKARQQNCSARFEEENKRLKTFETQYPKLIHEIERLQQFEAVCPALQDELAACEKQLLQVQCEKRNIESQLNRGECQNRSLRQENNEQTDGNLLFGNNKLAGTNVAVNNPNIADLSYEKRPTKLAEEFSELYDNEWTDAFEDVHAENEQEKSTIMLKLLKRANEICNELSSEHMNNIKKGLCTLATCVNDHYSSGDRNVHASPIEGHESNDTDNQQIKIDVNVGIEESSDGEVPGRLKTVSVYKVGCDFEQLQSDKKKAIMDLKKYIEDVISEQLPTVYGGLIADENGIDPVKQPIVFDYIQKCIKFCWSTCRHEPHLYISSPDITHDMLFDTNVYKPYTKTGKHIDFIVWPALYLHEDGPMLSKGVAQGKQ